MGGFVNLIAEISTSERLTSRQREVFEFLERFKLQHRGRPPSIREIAEHFQVSNTAISQSLQALRNKNWITIEPGISRGIELLRRSRQCE